MIYDASWRCTDGWRAARHDQIAIAKATISDDLPPKRGLGARIDGRHKAYDVSVYRRRRPGSLSTAT
jgi:hypothetical protein